MRASVVPRVTGSLIVALLTFVSLFLVLAPAEAAGNPYSEYEFRFLNGQVLIGTTEGSQGFEAPVFNTGYTVHVSCSTVYDDGWSNTGGFPNPTDHPDWEIASYHIDRYKGDGSFHFSCDQPWDTTTTTAQDTTTTTAQDTTTTTAQDTTTTTAQETTTTDVSVLAVQITTTSVSPETLPFTGPVFGNGGALGLATAMLALGGMAVLAVRRREDHAATVAEGWSDRLWTIE